MLGKGIDLWKLQKHKESDGTCQNLQVSSFSCLHYFALHWMRRGFWRVTRQDKFASFCIIFASSTLNHPEDCRQEASPWDPCPNYVSMCFRTFSPGHMIFTYIHIYSHVFTVGATGFAPAHSCPIWSGDPLLFHILNRSLRATWSWTVAFMLHHHKCLLCSPSEVAWPLRSEKQEKKHSQETFVQIMITHTHYLSTDTESAECQA